MATKRPAGTERLRFIDFQLPTLVDKAPEGDDWLHEVKWDGYRTELVIQDGAARAYTRRGFDWTSKYGLIADLAAGLPVKSAIIDGEVVVLDQHRSNMAALRLALGRFPERLVFVAFDLLHLDGEDLRRLPTTERRARLQQILPTDSGGPIQFSQHVTGGGHEFFAAAERLELEGIVSKRADAPYRSGRQPSWLKTKCFEISTYEVAGVLRQPGRPAIAYMVTPDKQRRYVGGAFITLAQKQRERLWARVQAKAEAPAGVKAKAGTEWLKRGMLGRVKHLKGEDELRHASLTDLDE